jgi:GWxTD domain-containing protein
LYPISTESEKAFSNQLVKGDDIYVMQQYLFTFWENRNITDPFTSFKKYMEKVKEADRAYATRVAPGYDTDRGRVFLKYGEPNSIAREYNDPAAYPYEIWHYYQTNGQRNVRFIFYNNDLSTNLFYLIHSTAIGEPNNYQWRLLIRGRDKGWRSIDDSGDDQDDWGSNYNRYYETPR